MASFTFHSLLAWASVLAFVATQKANENEGGISDPDFASWVSAEAMDVDSRETAVGVMSLVSGEEADPPSTTTFSSDGITDENVVDFPFEEFQTRPCEYNEPCGWAVYKKGTFTIDYYFANACFCDDVHVCKQREEQLAVGAKVFRCLNAVKPRPPLTRGF